MVKKNKILIGIVIIILFLFIIIYGMNRSSTSKSIVLEVPRSIAACDKQSDEIPQNMARDLCYSQNFQIAVREQDLMLCNQLGWHFSFSRSECYLRIAVAQLNLTICDMLGSAERDDCYSICYQIHNGKESKESGECYNRCDQRKFTSKKDSCYIVIGRANQDPTLCDKINNPSWKDDCYYDVALANREVSICDKIGFHSKRDLCYSNVGILKQDLSICDKSQELILWQKCYSGVGIAKRDPNICNKITILGVRGVCYEGVSNMSELTVEQIKELIAKV